jgi:hypothetical protein
MRDPLESVDLCGKMKSFIRAEAVMQDINPIVNKINELKGRVHALRGYL